MTSILTIMRPWRYRDPKRGSQVMKPGRYRVPGEIPQGVADRAVGEGMGSLEAIRTPAPKPIAMPAAKPATPVSSKPKRRRRKTPRLETKIIHVAENKAGLD